MAEAPHDALSTKARLEAADWDARLRSVECTPEDREQFAAWIVADPQNSAAFETLQGALASLRASSLTDPDLRRLRDSVLENGVRRRNLTFHRAAAAGVAALLLVSGGILFWPGHEERVAVTQPTKFETGTGERSLVSLPDGSRVTLDSRSTIELAYSVAYRRLTVARGQAFFEVAHDRARPFVVVAGGRSVTAVGTAFNVRTGAKNTTVTVAEGRVRVGRTGAHDSVAGRQLVAGERLIADPESGRDRVSLVDVATETSWRTGRALFEEAALGDVLDELNRYTDKPIVLDDPSLAALRISGTFTTAQPMRFVNGLPDYLPVEVHVDPRRVILSRRSGGPGREPVKRTD